MNRKTVKQKILDYMAARPDEGVFLRSEFDGLSKTRSSVDKAIRALIKEGVLVRVGWGVVARAKWNNLGQRYVPASRRFITEALEKLGARWWEDPEFLKALEDYNANRTTQVPMGSAFLIVDKRITRQIGFNKQWIKYAYGTPEKYRQPDTYTYS